jgi:hypothetical protein
MAKIVAFILRAIANRLDMANPLTLGITTDVGAVANMVTECFKAGMSVVDFFDQPSMVAARASAEEQKQKALDAKAVTDAIAGNPTTLEERSS